MRFIEIPYWTGNSYPQSQNTIPASRQQTTTTNTLRKLIFPKVFEISFDRVSDIIFKLFLLHGLKNVLVLERAGHTSLRLVVLQFCKLINISPMFSNFVGNTL